MRKIQNVRLIVTTNDGLKYFQDEDVYTGDFFIAESLRTVVIGLAFQIDEAIKAGILPKEGE